MPSKPTTRSITRCRSAFERATSRHSMSPLPVVVSSSSTSGTVDRWARTSAPWPCRIWSVANAVTG